MAEMKWQQRTFRSKKNIIFVDLTGKMEDPETIAFGFYVPEDQVWIQLRKHQVWTYIGDFNQDLLSCTKDFRDQLLQLIPDEFGQMCIRSYMEGK